MFKFKCNLSIASKVAVAVGVLSLFACVGSLFNNQSLYDSRPLQITTVSLFNQRALPAVKGVSWRGDWVFRRERLALVDQYLRQNVPDILLLQEAMQKRGSKFDADDKILAAGSLKDFQWLMFPVATYGDTVEQETMGYAFSAGAQQAELPAGQRTQWELGSHGVMTLLVLQGETHPLLVFNISLPALSHLAGKDDQDIWYRFIKDQVQDSVERLHSCPERVILGGLIAGNPTGEYYQELLEHLHLKDASTGYCQVVENCQTASPQNQIYLATVGDESPQRLDRILIHNSTIVYNSNRSFEVSAPITSLAKKYALRDVWATQRFGWSVNARFARCLLP